MRYCRVWVADAVTVHFLRGASTGSTFVRCEVPEVMRAVPVVAFSTLQIAIPGLNLWTVTAIALSAASTPAAICLDVTVGSTIAAGESVVLRSGGSGGRLVLDAEL